MTQKIVCVKKSSGYGWLLGQSAGPTYLGAQSGPDCGLAKDLAQGWTVKAIWEDTHIVTLLLERTF